MKRSTHTLLYIVGALAIVSIGLYTTSLTKGNKWVIVKGTAPQDMKIGAVTERYNYDFDSAKKFRARNGRFSRVMFLNPGKVYALCIPGEYGFASFSRCDFFVDGNTATFNVTGIMDNYDIENISESPLNVAYNDYLKKRDEYLDSLELEDPIGEIYWSDQEMLTEEYLELSRKLGEETITRAEIDSITKKMDIMTKDGSSLNQKGREYKELLLKSDKRSLDYDRAHIEDLPFGLASFDILVDAMYDSFEVDYDVHFWADYYRQKYELKFVECNLHSAADRIMLRKGFYLQDRSAVRAARRTGRQEKR